MRAQKPAKHGRDHAGGGEDPVPVVQEIKIVADDDVVAVGDGQFVWGVSDDMDGHKLVKAHGFVSAASSSGTPTVQIRNVTRTVDLLSTRITIDANEFTSYTAATASVPNTTGTPANNQVFVGELLAVDVDVAGTAVAGLGVILTWNP